MRPALSFRTRISLVCTALAAALLLTLGGLWLNQTRNGIYEEIEAANRVAVQWLRVMAVHPLAEEDVLTTLRDIGRIRANGLEAFAADGNLRYRAPGPVYKAGRQAPAWFAALVQPTFPPIAIPLGQLTLVLTPDASRATLDAWDDLTAMTGWALALLGVLFLATWRALNRSLHPLDDVMAALDKTGQGQFSTRLPLYPVPELMRLARSFNAMNDRLDDAVRHNVRLESEQAVAVRINARLEDERTAIARELHDELAQGITAVRALAGAIAQRTRDKEQLHSTAQSILAVTGEMQQEVRGILQRLRPAAIDRGLAEALERHLLAWRSRHSGIRLEAELGELPALDEDQSQALLRLVQEGLTNVVRHADARCVQVRLYCDGSNAIAEVVDDGRGLAAARAAASQLPGFGLTGLRERLVGLGGQLGLDTPPQGGTRLRATLPLPSSPCDATSLETVSCLPQP